MKSRRTRRDLMARPISPFSFRLKSSHARASRCHGVRRASDFQRIVASVAEPYHQLRSQISRDPSRTPPVFQTSQKYCNSSATTALVDAAGAQTNGYHLATAAIERLTLLLRQNNFGHVGRATELFVLAVFAQ
eukprot:1078996-Pyramimonas_sp.AAC.1